MRPVTARVLLSYGVALTVAAVVSVSVLVANAPSGSEADRVEIIASELRCPVCQGLSLADSPSSTAQELRRQIGQMLDEGRSPNAIKDHFAARYGDWILLSPRPSAAWLVPPLVIVAGTAGATVWVVRRARPRPEAEREAADALATLRARVREEVRELDA